MNDITFRVWLQNMIHFLLMAKEDNVNRAFLDGKLEEWIYMKCPISMKDVGKNDCIILG